VEGTFSFFAGVIIHDLLVIELFDGEYYRDLEMWVRGHSRSLKMVSLKAWVQFPIPFHNNLHCYYVAFCTIFYILFFLPFTVNKVMCNNYGRIFSHVGDIHGQTMA